MARRPAKRPASRPLIGVTIGGQAKPPTRKARKARRLANTRAVARRVATWGGRGIGAGAARAADTTSRAAARTHARVVEHRENRREHGRRPVVRDLTLDPSSRRPLSPGQVQSQLLGLDTARAHADGRPGYVPSSRVARPVDNATLLRVAAPIRLSWWQRRQLPADWTVDDVHAAQTAITTHLVDQVEARTAAAARGDGWGPAAAVDVTPPTPLHAVPDPGAGATRTRGTPAVIEPTNFADLANPAIEQATWTEELPAHAQLVVRLTQQPAEGLRALADYHRAAQSREDIVAAYEEAANAAQSAQDQCAQAAQRAEEWASSVRLPDFSRAG